MSTDYQDYSGDPKILHAKVNVELAVGDVCKIKYIKPDGTSGMWTGAREDRDGDSTYKWIKYTVPYGTTITGAWHLHAYVEFSGMSSGEGVHGSVCDWQIDNLGE